MAEQVLGSVSSSQEGHFPVRGVNDELNVTHAVAVPAPGAVHGINQTGDIRIIWVLLSGWWPIPLDLAGPLSGLYLLRGIPREKSPLPCCRHALLMVSWSRPGWVLPAWPAGSGPWGRSPRFAASR